MRFCEEVSLRALSVNALEVSVAELVDLPLIRVPLAAAETALLEGEIEDAAIYLSRVNSRLVGYLGPRLGRPWSERGEGVYGNPTDLLVEELHELSEPVSELFAQWVGGIEEELSTVRATVALGLDSSTYRRLEGLLPPCRDYLDRREEVILPAEDEWTLPTRTELEWCLETLLSVALHIQRVQPPMSEWVAESLDPAQIREVVTRVAT